MRITVKLIAKPGNAVLGDIIDKLDNACFEVSRVMTIGGDEMHVTASRELTGFSDCDVCRFNQTLRELDKALGPDLEYDLQSTDYSFERHDANCSCREYYYQDR